MHALHSQPYTFIILLVARNSHEHQSLVRRHGLTSERPHITFMLLRA